VKESVLILSQRYAGAVLGLAVEADATTKVGDQLATLAEVCFPDAKARAFWRSLKVPADERRHTLQDILERMDAHGLVRNTANLLMDRGRFELLPDLVAAYRRKVKELSLTVDAKVTSAGELDSRLLAEIRQGLTQMTGKSVSLTTEVDPALISGIRVRVGNKVIDGSARGRLEAIGRSFA